MSLTTRHVKKHAKARRRRYCTAQERLARDRRQAQHAAETLKQALDDLGLPEDLVTEIEGRLRSGFPISMWKPRCSSISPVLPSVRSNPCLWPSIRAGRLR